LAKFRNFKTLLKLNNEIDYTCLSRNMLVTVFEIQGKNPKISRSSFITKKYYLT
jgi:hypothetical protein